MGQFGDSAQGEALETANQPGPPPNAPPNAKEMGHVSDAQFSWEEQNKKAARHRQCVHMSSPSSIGVSSPLSLSKIACLPLIRERGTSRMFMTLRRRKTTGQHREDVDNL
eukprot:jgi/Botrbrau1/15333/Bobra.0379s0005.1